MNNQDWNQVVFKKQIPITTKSSVQTYNNTKTRKLEDYTGGEDDLLCESNNLKKTFKQNNLKHVLKSYRREHNMSQKDLATKLNLKQDIITSIEGGKMKPDSVLIQRINNKLF